MFRKTTQRIFALYRDDPAALLGYTLIAALLAGVCIAAALYPRQVFMFLNY